VCFESLLQPVINDGEMGRYFNALHSVQLLPPLIIMNQITAHGSFIAYIYVYISLFSHTIRRSTATIRKQNLKLT